MRTSKRKQLVHAQRKALEEKRSAESKARKAEEEGKRQGRGHCEGNPAQSGRKESRRDPESEEGDRKEERASELSEDASQGLSENGRKKKADPGRAAREAGGVKAMRFRQRLAHFAWEHTVSRRGVYREQ